MKVRKKPVEVEARFIEGNTFIEVAKWCDAIIAHNSDFMTIQTLEGGMKAYVGDWIIKGVNGEFYPCKKDIFEKTYDIVDDEIIDHTFVPPTIEVVSIDEQEDGSAIISFDMDIETVKMFAGVGLKKVLMDSVEETLKNES